jgi:hypothetical protein
MGWPDRRQEPRLVVSVPAIKNRQVYFVVNQVMKAIFKGPGQGLSVKVYRYRLSLGIIIVLISRHISPLLTKRSLRVLRSSVWRYYHALMTFSTASTFSFRGRCVATVLSKRVLGHRYYSSGLMDLFRFI